jgi:hypothetical protein
LYAGIASRRRISAGAALARVEGFHLSNSQTVIASEAKQSSFWRYEAKSWIASSLPLLAMTAKYDVDGQTRLRIPAARFSPGVCQRFPYPRDQRAQGIPGARCTRGLVCKVAQKNAHEHTGSAEAVRHSLRNGFTGYFVLFPAIRLCCHRRPQEACFSRT